MQQDGQSITQALNEVVADFPKLNLTGYDGYDTKLVDCVDDDLRRVVYNSPSFPFLESLRSSDRLMTFKEILASPVDEDDDYQ